MTSKAQQYVSGLFQHGLELYDSSKKDTPSKGVVNPGGAKVFLHIDYKTNSSKIVFNNSQLEKAIKDVPGALLYALNRVALDSNLKPEMLNTSSGSRGFRRIYTGLMVYLPSGNTEAIKGAIVDSITDVDVSDYVIIGSDVVDDTNKLEVIKKIIYQNFARDLVPLELRNCIFFALPSGAPNSSQFWSYSNQRITSRATMSNSTSASSVETEGLLL
jgi:hypothetical protein